MIVDKKKKVVISDNATAVDKDSHVIRDPNAYDVQEQIPANSIIEVFKAVCETLENIQWEYGKPDSPKIFKTVQMNDGQYARIVSSHGNTEYALGFPAAFVHFIDIRWLNSMARFREGKAEMRIYFVLNRLNVHDTRDTEAEGWYVGERINQAIEEATTKYECLQRRCKLTYFDQTNSFDNGLQCWWMTYEVWFKETSIWVTRTKTRRFIVMPPFTNHADQNPDIKDINPSGHNNLDHPAKYDEQTGYINKLDPLPVEGPIEEEGGTDEEE